MLIVMAVAHQHAAALLLMLLPITWRANRADASLVDWLWMETMESLVRATNTTTTTARAVGVDTVVGATGIAAIARLAAHLMLQPHKSRRRRQRRPWLARWLELRWSIGAQPRLTHPNNMCAARLWGVGEMIAVGWTAGERNQVTAAIIVIVVVVVIVVTFVGIITVTPTAAGLIVVGGLWLLLRLCLMLPSASMLCHSTRKPSSVWNECKQKQTTKETNKRTNERTNNCNKREP